MKKIKGLNKGLSKYIKDKRAENEKKILQAIKDLFSQSKKITMGAIAENIGMTRVNMYAYKDFIDSKKGTYKIEKTNKKKNTIVRFKNDGLRKYEENKRLIKQKKILEAINKLKKIDEKVTIGNIAILLKVTRASLYTYKDFIDSNRAY